MDGSGIHRKTVYSFVAGWGSDSQMLYSITCEEIVGLNLELNQGPIPQSHI